MIGLKTIVRGVPFGAIISLLFLLSCIPDNDLTQPQISNYFPLQKNKYWVYDVSETQIDLNGSTDLSYQIKMIVTDSVFNANGNYSYIVTRTKRDSEVEEWQNFDTWLVREDNAELVITENNIPFVRLSFPVKTGNEWNANKYNSQITGLSCTNLNVYNTCDVFSYSAGNSTFENSFGTVYADAIEIEENNSIDPNDKIDIRKSIYSFKVGLVYREVNIQIYCTRQDCSSQDIEEGHVQKLELIEYGKE